MIQGITEINLPSYATLSSATIVDNEMGDKTIEATVAIDSSIVPDFSYNWELEFKGERYIQPLREPQGNKSNESIKAHMDLTFYHKVTYQLKRYFFFETASVGAGSVIADKYEASVYLDLGEFVTMFNEVLNYYFGDDIVMDLNPNWEYSSEKVFIEISSSYIWDVLQKVNELYGVRWRISGDTIYVGYADVELSHVFEYGFTGGLMKLERQVQDPSIKNQLLGRGGSKNLPQYYFKTAPEGSGFTSDPDACPELQNIYFDELRGKTFRDYVKGWNAKHYGGDPMEDPTVAYTKGYTDTVFSPIEYVEDPVSIARYGVLQGILDSNEDIFPSIKGRTVSPYGRIDEIIDAEEPDKDNYDQDENAYNDSKATILSTLRQSVNVAAHGTGQITLPRSEVFTVPEGKIGTIESWIGQWSGYYYLNGEQKDAKGLLDYDVTDTSFVVYNATTGNVVSGTNLPAGSYYFVASGEVSNISNYQIYATFEIANVRLVVAAPGDQGWKYTFDIWVKNIWQSTQQSGESDEDYAHRVWSPILGSHGEEARVLFDSGWLYGHEDWEFPIISVHKDQSKLRGGIRSEWRLTLKKSDAEIEATGKYIPSSEETVQAHAGDHFHFIGIDMPFIYVEMAEADLDEYKTQQLAQYSDIKPTWVVTMDHVRLQTKLGSESQTFYQQLESGAMIYIRNNQLTDNASIAFYLESITYTWSSDTVIIPNVEVVLSDKVKTVYSPVSLMQSDIRALNSQVGSLKEAAVRASVASASMYLPKDGTPAKSLSETTFAKTVTGSEFREGQLGGVDWGIYRDENGKAIIEADKVVAREQLVVNDLVVNQITYQGGMQIISAASMECIRVDDTTDGYVCYFDQKQGSVANLFQVGDVAYSHIFNEVDLSLKYYKRKVVAIGSNYITLSKTVYDGTGIPMAGDNIIQYGSYTDATRRFVIIRDVIGGGYERMLSGLDSVTATGKEYYYAGKQNGGERWFVGDKGTDGQYAEYVNGQLNLKAVVNFLPNSTGLEQMEAYQKLVEIANGNIQAWFSDGVTPAQTGAPTLNNYPANQWTTATEKDTHIGDLYYSNEGKAYRFRKSGNSYEWTANVDTDIARALAAAQEAKDAAEDAQGAVDALDEDVADFKDYVDGSFKDGVINQTEKERIEAYKKQIATSKADADSSYSKVYNSQYLDNAGKAALLSAKTAYDTKYTALISAIDTAIADSQITPSEITAVNNAYDQYNTAYGTLVTALGTANEKIQGALLAAMSDEYGYLKDALEENTTITGGLILSSLIQLGYTDSSDVYHVMSGISGQGSDAHAIAAWYGGSMLDRYEYVNGQYVLKDPIPQGAATSLVRFDGTGYFAKGNIFWDEDGYGQVGGTGDNYAVKWDANGVSLGNGIKLGSSDETLASLIETLNTLSSRIGVFEGWFGEDSAGDIFVKKKNNVDRNFWTYGNVSAGGNGGGGGGGGVLYALNDIYHNDSSVLRADGTEKQPGDALVYNSTRGKWVASPVGSGSGTVTQIKVGTTPYDPVDGVVTLPAYPSYSLPVATSSALGGIKIGASVTGKNYAVQLDANNKAYVSVPWENTTYSNATQSAAGLMSKDDKTKLDGIAQGATAVSNSTVLGWGFVKSVASKTPDSSGNVALSAADLGAETTAHASQTYQPISTAINTGNIGSQAVDNALYLKSQDKRNQYPAAIVPNYNRLGMSFMNNSTLGISGYGNYSDVIVIRGYRDSSGGDENALIFNKNSNTVWHAQFSPESSSSWGTKYKFWDSGNFNPADYLPLSGGTMTGNITLGTNAIVFNNATSSSWSDAMEMNGIRLLNTVGAASDGAPTAYAVGLSVRGYYGFTLAHDGGGGRYWLKGSGDNAWLTLYHSGNSNKSDVPWTASQLTIAPEGRIYMSGNNSYGSSTWGIVAYGPTFQIENRGAGVNPIIIGASNIRLFQAGDGNVAVGGATASEKLHVYGNILATGNLSIGNTLTMSGDEVLFAASTNLYINRGLQTRTVDFFGTDIRFRNTGKVGIGTTSPIANFDVRGSVFFSYGSDATLKFYGATNPLQPSTYGPETFCIQSCFDNQDGQTSTHTTTYPNRCVLALQPRGGRVAIGALSSGYALYVVGDTVATGEVTAGSDKRWKNDIRPVFNGIDTIMKLQPSTWTWNKEHGGTKGAGLVAQSVAEILPYAVKGSEEQGYTLNYNVFHAFEISALQNHESRIETLERENKELKAEIKRLRS